MNDKQHMLIVDDSGRFNGTTLFDPEYTVHRETNKQDALTFLHGQPDIAIILISLETSIEDSLDLLVFVRSRPTPVKPIVGICMPCCNAEIVERACEAQVDELILQPASETVLNIQLHKLIRLRKAQDALWEQQRSNHLLTMINRLTTGMGIFEYNDGQLLALFVNEAFLRGWRFLLGENTECEGNLLSLLPAKEAEVILTAILEHRQSGVPVDMLLHMPFQDNGEVSLRMRAFPIHYEDRETPVFLANFTDITDQYQAEKALQESNQKLASLMNAVPGGIAVYDLTEQPRLLYHNDVLSDMCGYTAEEYDQIMATDYKALVDPRDRAMVCDMIAAFREQPQHMENFFRIITKNGSSRWTRMSVSPVGNGLLCNAVFIDATRDKENEARNERMLKEIYYRNEHDALTGIINRESFYRQTAEMLHANPAIPYAIIVMDIDRFKVVNEMFGKEVGDRILIAIGQGLKHLLSNVGTFARMEADHFVMCIPQKLLDMDRIMRVVDIGLKRQRIDYHIQMSYGIYPIRNIGVPVNHMCDRAVMALKTIKGNAVQRYAFYDDKLRQTLLEENAILDEMYEALAQDQFVIYLQPIFTVDTNQPVSAEVLVRWQHPVKGLIAPGKFIPLFERNGFITKLDFYIWDKACALLSQWKALDYPLPISVNISRIDLYYPHLCEHLVELTRRYEIDPANLRLEITESAYSKDPEALLEVISQLRAAGFAILMDDFGSGYSSLNVLMDMPVDMIKLDMRFLAQLNTNPRASSILSSVVSMAKWLHMPVVAEGVETWEQLSFLRSIGCDHVQGFLFAKPVSVETYTRQYIDNNSVALASDLLLRRETGNLAFLWNGDPQTDALFNGMIGGMGIYELCGDALEVRRVNDGYYELFGCTPKQVFEREEDALFTVHPDDRAGLTQICKKAAQTKHVERYVCRHIHRRDGRQTWLEAKLRHLGKAGLNDVFCFIFNDVTEQKEFEQARSLKNYAMVLRTVYASVYEINLTSHTMRAVYAGGEIPAQFATEQPLAVMQTIFSEMLATPDAELEEQLFTSDYLNRRLRENQNGYYVLERKVVSKKSRGSWASFTFVRMPMDTADEVYLLCIADVDSRKRTDDLLLENQWLQSKQKDYERYQMLLEHLGTSLLEWDVRTGNIIISKGFERFALSAFDLRTLQSHKDVEPYIYAQDLYAFRTFVNSLLAHGNATVTLRLLATDGAPVWCRVLCTLVCETPGHIDLCILGINQIDEEMKIRESFLDEQTRFQAFSDNFMIGLGVFESFGDSHRILFLSDGYRRMIGYRADETLYTDDDSFLGVHPEDLPRFQKASRELLETGNPYTIEYRVFHKDGRILWLRSHNRPFPGVHNGRLRIFAVMQDITQEKTLRQNMNTLLAQIPMGVGMFELSEQPCTPVTNQRMTAWLSLPLAASPASPLPDEPAGLHRDVLTHIRESFAKGQTAFDELLSLRQADGTIAHAHVLATVVVTDEGARCYCAVVDVDEWQSRYSARPNSGER